MYVGVSLKDNNKFSVLDSDVTCVGIVKLFCSVSVLWFVHTSFVTETWSVSTPVSFPTPPLFLYLF